MKNSFDRFLSRQAFIVLDGAMATELEAMGADLDDPLWSAKVLLEAPHLIREVHKSYLLAGADIITTASYQASYNGFAQRGISNEKADHLFRLSVELAAEARAAFWTEPDHRQGRTFPVIAASIGPYGAYQADGSEYHGDYGLSMEELIEWHRPQLKVPAKEKEVDILFFETVPSLLEAKAVLHLLKDFPTVSCSLSFSCKDGVHLSHGERFRDAVELVAASPQVIAVGVNCTAPEFISPLLESVKKQQLSKPLIVYPNSGETWDAAQHCWRKPAHLPDIPALVEAWYERGARIIGGCCRTSPEQIREIRQQMEALNKVEGRK